MRKSRKTASLEHPPAASMGAPLSLIERVDEITDGEKLAFEASATERATIANLLDLAGLDRLSLVCTLQKQGQGRLLLRGTLAASLTQTCVVSLEPFVSAIQVPVEIEFWPAERVAELMREAEETGNHGLLEWPEPVVEGKVDLGPVIYETLSTSLDPYPRREGASFEWQEQGSEPPGEAKAESPFAALESLKRE